MPLETERPLTLEQVVAAYQANNEHVFSPEEAEALKAYYQDNNLPLKVTGEITVDSGAAPVRDVHYSGIQND